MTLKGIFQYIVFISVILISNHNASADS